MDTLRRRAKALRISRFSVVVSTLVLLPSMLSAAAPTATILTVAPGATVPAGTAVTLTATVTAGGAPVTPGLVLFCNAAAAHCVDVNILGQGQLTSEGTARVALRLGIGSHSIKAVFQGTNTNAASSSATQQVAITGKLKTQTAVAVSGKTFAARVLSEGSLPATGPVAFGDMTNGGKQVAWTNLGSATAQLGFSQLFNASLDNTELPYGMVSGDFNGDGLPDIAVARWIRTGNPFNPFSYSFDVYLNDGSGQFTDLKAGPPPYNVIAAADFNSDGKLDLLDAGLDVFLGDGTGKFTLYAGSSPITESAQFVSVGDFNHDGIPDVAIVHPYTQNGNFSAAAVYLGDGKGGFTLQSEFPFPQSNETPTVGLAIGDFNRDGYLDVVVGLQADSQAFPPISAAVVLLLNDGMGNLQQAPNSPFSLPTGLGTTPQSGILAADFNGDGIADLAALGGPGGQNGVFVLLNDGVGGFTFEQLLETGPQNVGTIAVGDFNGDGHTDIFAAVEENSGPNSEAIDIFQGDGTGKFSLIANVGELPLAIAPSNLPTLSLGDFSGSGNIDFAAIFEDTSFSPQLYSLQVWKNALYNISIVEVPNVEVLGTGTHHVFAQYTGDADHARSVSTTWSVPGSGSGERALIHESPGTE